MKKHNGRYYCIDKKGVHVFADILEIHKADKEMIFINDYEVDENFGLNEIKVFRFTMNKIIQQYQKKGYLLKEVDGAKERLTKKEVFDALRLKYPLEKLYLLSQMRAQVYPYYDKEIIQNAMKAYLDRKIDGIYLSYWSLLYSSILQESYNVDSDKLTSLFIASVSSLLDELLITRSQNASQEEKDEQLKHSFTFLNEIDKTYHDQIKGRKKRIQKYMVDKEKQDKERRKKQLERTPLLHPPLL